MAARTGLFGGIFARGGVDTGDEAWLRAMLETEAALARALERAGLVPAGSGAAVTEAARSAAPGEGGSRPAALEVDGLGRQAALAGNPVPALVRALSALVPAPARPAVHLGATSQDVIDTAAMLLAGQALDAIGADLATAAAAAARLAAGHRDTLMIGRTLLQQAVPTTFGLVAAGWMTALDESRAALERAGSRLAVQFGGAAGTLSALGTDGRRVMGLLAEELGLAAPVLPWHTDRSRIADVGCACARACGALGKVARDVTLLAQAEVGEVREGEVREGEVREGEAGEGRPGGVRRGGSSAMPHKRNPVAAVAVLGCVRQVPGLVSTLLAAAEQEHQRAAGAWHAEWAPFSDILRLAGSAAAWGAELLAGLSVDAGRMRSNLDAAGGLPMAGRVAGLLAPAMGRLGAHDLLSRASADAAARGRPLTESLLSDPGARERLEAAGVSRADVEAALDPAGYLGAAGAFVDAALAAHRERG